MDLGPAPVRLDPDGRAEVVWGRRIDPARVVVMNVPTPGSGHRWGDVVLHDGAPNGGRRARGRVYGVFDELERWQPSAVPTLEVQVTLTDETDAQALADLFDQAGYAAQDWTPLSGRSAGNAAKGSHQNTMNTRPRLPQPSAGSAWPPRWTRQPASSATGQQSRRATAGTAIRLSSDYPQLCKAVRFPEPTRCEPPRRQGTGKTTCVMSPICRAAPVWDGC
jgi:hypothetical protein